MNKLAWHKLAAALLALLVALASLWLWNGRHTLTSRVDTDLFALLPHDQRDTHAEAAQTALARHGERQLVVLLEAADAEQATKAARIWREAMAGAPLKLRTTGMSLESIRDFYRPYRQALQTPDDQNRLLRSDAEYWRQRAVTGAYSPFGGNGLAWQDDPFGLFGNWLMSLGDVTRVRPVGDFLMVESEGRHYAVLPYELTGSAFDEQVQQQVLRSLAQAEQRVRQAVPCRVLRAGIVLHAAKAMETAQWEMSVIGLGGMIGVFLLVVFSYKGWRAPVLITISLGIGTLLAAAATFLIFPRVHVLTLVFGSSLIGVAEDYAIHALTYSLDDSTPPLQRYRRIFPGLALAWLTTALAYLGLMLTPFPALAQMAVFSTTGITAAWLVVMFWFPWLAPPQLRPGPLARGFFHCRLPSVHMGARWRIAGIALLLTLGIWGLLRLDIRDDVRAMSGVNPELLQEQIKVGRILSLASPAQMFMISGADPQSVLELEEKLVGRLAPFIEAGKLSGLDALSRWAPSHLRQQEQRALLDRQLISRPGLIERISDEIGLPGAWSTSQRQASQMLNFEDWLAAPVSQPFRHLWLGRNAQGQYGSLVLLKGLNSQQVAAELAQLAGPNVRWIDRPTEISRVMAYYRVLLGVLLLVTYAATTLGLYLRYRKEVWRVLLPPALASILTLALMGWTEKPLQLLNMASLLLVLGMGVDFGIFLLEHTQENDRRGMLAMTLAAITSLLSFGLLAFSSTPTLHSFGFATMSGIGLTWWLALQCRRRHEAVA